jgi:hypothetical protein
LDILKPTTAFLGTMYVGTNRLGRALTAPENKDLASLFRKHDFVEGRVNPRERRRGSSAPPSPALPPEEGGAGQQTRMAQRGRGLS